MFNYTIFGCAVKGKIFIDIEVCKGCLYCVEACPNDLIAAADRLNTKGYYPALFNPCDDNGCTACTLCAISCPEAAIEVYRDEK
jgi:2-oxoglutarate ferredoxin oxidoreductase subunit delta